MLVCECELVAVFAPAHYVSPALTVVCMAFLCMRL